MDCQIECCNVGSRQGRGTERKTPCLLPNSSTLEVKNGCEYSSVLECVLKCTSPWIWLLVPQGTRKGKIAINYVVVYYDRISHTTCNVNCNGFNKYFIFEIFSQSFDLGQDTSWSTFVCALAPWASYGRQNELNALYQDSCDIYMSIFLHYHLCNWLVRLGFIKLVTVGESELFTFCNST